MSEVALLCLASYHNFDDFLKEAKASVPGVLLTAEKWARMDVALRAIDAFT